MPRGEGPNSAGTSVPTDLCYALRAGDVAEAVVVQGDAELHQRLGAKLLLEQAMAELESG